MMGAMPSPDELRAAIVAYVDAVNARDPEAVAALFTDDAVQADPASNPPNVGRQAIAAFFAAGIAGSEDWTFRAERVHTCADQVAINFAIDIVNAGTTMTISGIEVFTAATDGRFSSVYAYWDESDLTFA